MAETANILTYTGLYSRVTAVKGLSTSDAKALVNDGYMMFLRDYTWSFAVRPSTFIVWPAVAVSAATVSASTLNVTATVASFYPSMVGRTLTLTGITPATRTITGYTSSTVVTVDSTFAGTPTFSIVAGEYGLVSDHDALVDDPVITVTSSLQTYPVRLIRKTPEELIRLVQESESDTDTSECYAIRPRTFSATTGQRWDMLLYPIPDAAVTLIINERFVVNQLSADGDFHMGGPNHSLTILEAAYALHEMNSGQTHGVHWKGYQEMLKASVNRDILDHQTMNLGQYAPAASTARALRIGGITYNGV